MTALFSRTKLGTKKQKEEFKIPITDRKMDTFEEIFEYLLHMQKSCVPMRGDVRKCKRKVKESKVRSLTTLQPAIYDTLVKPRRKVVVAEMTEKLTSTRKTTHTIRFLVS